MATFREESVRAAANKVIRLENRGPKKLPSGAIVFVVGLFLVLAVTAAQLEIDRSSRHQASLEYVRGSVWLRSPIDGQVASLPVSVGAAIEEGQEAVTVVAARRVRSLTAGEAFAGSRNVVESSFETLEEGVKAQYRRKADVLHSQLRASAQEKQLLESELRAVSDSLQATDAMAKDYQTLVDRQLLPRIEAHRIQNELAGKRANRDQISRALVAATSRLEVIDEELALLAVEQALELERLSAQKRGELVAVYGDEANYFGGMLSPSDGVVSEVLVSQGEAVARNQDLIEILTSDAALGFKTNVDARTAAWTQTGLEIPLRVYLDQAGDPVRAFGRIESKTPIRDATDSRDTPPQPPRFQLVVVLTDLDAGGFVPSLGQRVEADMPSGKETLLQKLAAPFLSGTEGT